MEQNKEHKKRGPKPHVPTEANKKLVESLAMRGLPHKMIVSLIDGVGTADTLREYYQEQLDIGNARACASVAGKLYEKCMEGDTASILFWHKTRMGFRENAPVVDLNASKDDKQIIINIVDAKKPE